VIQQDFKDMLVSFNARRVEYVIVGSQALAFHGAPRYTGDIDLLIKPDESNAQKVLAALADFGFADLDISPADISKPDQIVQLGRQPVRIDIITSISGVSWEEVAAHAVPGTYDSVPVLFIGKNEFIVNKKAVGRNKDLADVDAIEGKN